jgi:Outer membrane protein beta-barrel domain
MKKIILSAAAIILSLAGFAQFSFGVQATGNLATASVKDPQDFDFSKTSKVLPGAGVVVQYAFNQHIAVRSGVNYLQNGVKLKATADVITNMNVVVENKLNYIQVPVNVLYTKSVSEWQFFAGAGGFVSYGISGKSKGKLSYTMPDGHEAVTIEEVKAFKKEEDGGAGLKRFDAGIGALAGVRLANGIFANVGYQLSLTNISRDEDVKYKNRGLQLTVGYFF